MLYSSECLPINKFRLPAAKTSLDPDIIIIMFQGPYDRGIIYIFSSDEENGYVIIIF